MATEIERRFLVNNSEIEQVIKDAGVKPTRILQGYLDCKGATVRIRLEGTDKAYLVVKGPKVGLSCLEFDYEIPRADAVDMFKLTIGHVVVKDRYKILYRGHEWEVDIFLNSNIGLTIAEIELSSEEEYFQFPSWLDKEITSDLSYSNYNLSLKPIIFRK